ncbi:alpha/beta hydrolase [Nocardioides sambongensis]|uniref:alpha/beta hydrolase n=1 Tax=Nocardioides sambongensis TaxID=2589074 RepID=UPI001E2CA63F|nr:alpha/beta hydrolase [Nocardioides sambongensis]
MSLQHAIEAAVLKTLLALPEPVVRRLAGAPYVADGQTLAPDTQLMLRLQRLARMPGAEDLPLDRARQMIRRQSATVAGHQPIGAARDLEVAGMPARHYLPTARARGAGPLLLFFHGGGFLYGDLDSHDAPCRVLAERSGVPVLSVEYRLAPESAFPGPFDDAEAAYRWVLDHADELALDPDRLIVGGDSAGGNIAAWVAIAAARARTPLAHQLLIYPVTDPAHGTESFALFKEGLFLTEKFMDGVRDAFVPTEELRLDERVDLLKTDLPAGLAPAYLCTAGFDPLRDEGESYAARLAAAGVPVETRRFDDQIHGFLNVVGAGRTARAAVEEIADALRRAAA